MKKKPFNLMKSFTKNRLRHGAIANLCQDVYDKCSEADIPALAIVLTYFKDKIDFFNSLIHPIMGSSITADIAQEDDNRDTRFVGLKYYIRFALRHTDPAIVEAAKRINVVLQNESYKAIYNEPYDVETNTIQNLLSELRTNYADDIDTLQIGFYLDSLEQANDNFEALSDSRDATTGRIYTYIHTLEARAEMEDALDSVRLQLNAFVESTMFSGGPENYDSLIVAINNRIDRVVAAARHHYKDDDDEKEKGDEEGNTNENNNGTDNGADDGFGEENTPSANA